MNGTQLIQPLQLHKEAGKGDLVAQAALELNAHELLDLAAAEQPITQRLGAPAPGLGIEIVVVGTMLHEAARMRAIGIPSAPLEGLAPPALFPARYSSLLLHAGGQERSQIPQLLLAEGVG